MKDRVESSKDGNCTNCRFFSGHIESTSCAILQEVQSFACPFLVIQFISFVLLFGIEPIFGKNMRNTRRAICFSELPVLQCGGDALKSGHTWFVMFTAHEVTMLYYAANFEDDGWFACINFIRWAPPEKHPRHPAPSVEPACLYKLVEIK